MQYFTKSYVEFFRALEKDNNKEWFHANKKWYEKDVKQPMVAFVTDLIAAMKKYDKDFNAEPKKCIGRINRDIRFSKDKTPYNKHLFAHVTKGSKEDPLPGIAFRFGGGDCGIMSGFYKPSKERLQAIRQNIVKDVKGFQKLTSDKNFKKKFGSVQGEAYKRIPPDLQATYEKEPLIANKQFYYVDVKKPSFVHSKNLKEEIMEYWMAVRKLNDFLG